MPFKKMMLIIIPLVIFVLIFTYRDVMFVNRKAQEINNAEDWETSMVGKTTQNPAVNSVDCHEPAVNSVDCHVKETETEPLATENVSPAAIKNKNSDVEIKEKDKSSWYPDKSTPLPTKQNAKIKVIVTTLKPAPTAETVAIENNDGLSTTFVDDDLYIQSKKKKANHLIKIDTVADITTDCFRYNGIIFKKVDDNNVSLSVLSIENLTKYTLKNNMHVIFYNKNKTQIGEYQTDKNDLITKNDKVISDYATNQMYVGEDEIMGGFHIQISDFLEGDNTSSDIKYYKICNIKYTKPSPTPKATRQSIKD